MEASLVTTIETPAPGVYPRIPSEDYHRWKALSSSMLKRIVRSPSHLRDYLDNPKPSTKDQIFHTAIHTAVLEPDRFVAEYVKAPALDRRTKEGKAAWAVLMETYGASRVLDEDDYATCIAARAGLLEMPKLMELLRLDDPALVDFELSFVWEENGVLCKGRADLVNTHYQDGALVDLKSTNDARPHKFQWQMRDNGDHVQGAFYSRGLIANGIPIEACYLVAIEDSPPARARGYRIHAGLMEHAEIQVSAGVAAYKDCLATDKWPGYEDRIESIGAPQARP